MLPGNTDTAGPRNILWEPLAQSNSSQLQDLKQMNHLRSWNNNPTKSSAYLQWFLFRRSRIGLGIKLEVIFLTFQDDIHWFLSGLYYFWWEVSEKKFLSLLPYRQCVLFPSGYLADFFFAFQIPEKVSRYGILCVYLPCDLLSFLYLWVYVFQQI